MKINRNITNLLILYFSIYVVLYTALYLMMPFYFTNTNLYSFSGVIINTILFLISIFSIVFNTNKNNNKNCDNTYWICKNTPFLLFILNIILSCILIIFFKSINTNIICLISIFASDIFYIFSQNQYKNILDFSEKNIRLKTNSIKPVKRFNFIINISLSTNLMFEIFPLLISVLCFGLLIKLEISSIIYMACLLIISILSIAYISVMFNNTIISIVGYTTNTKNEFDNLVYEINSIKELYNKNINKLKENQNNLLEEQVSSSIEVLRRTVDAKDTYTRGHSDRVSEYSVLIGKKLNLPEEDLKLLKTGALFHDIGKIGIPDSVLLKEGRLTDEEYGTIKTHPEIGAHILETSINFNNSISIILHHHERYDGNGYPGKLKGDEIPYMARIVAVADTFDAMTSKRSYRNALNLDIVKNEIQKCSGTQFDPSIANTFLDILNHDYNKIDEIMKIYPTK